MAALNQDLIKFEHDSWVLRFTVTDASTPLTNYSAWWGLSDDNTPFGSVLLEGWESGGTGNYNVVANAEGCSSNTVTNLGGATKDFLIIMGTYTIDVPLVYDDFELVGDGDFYHELVLIPEVSSIRYQCRSVVAATGLLTVRESMFTNYIYR